MVDEFLEGGESDIVRREDSPYFRQLLSSASWPHPHSDCLYFLFLLDLQPGVHRNISVAIRRSEITSELDGRTIPPRNIGMFLHYPCVIMTRGEKYALMNTMRLQTPCTLVPA